ncbi:MAG: CPBP family intramembrane metalloprotease [candidate division Zixibacteria bacterium]|nr:CPBP family intramembrane metalloprotease [candidate division Zixibacteria bacterium]
MLGLLVILACTWTLLYVFEKRSLLALGFTPILQRIRQFTIGFLFTATLSAFFLIGDSLFRESQWIINNEFSYRLLLYATWWDFKSVLTEDLLFRGGVLYLLIRRFGVRRSVLASALAFSAFHLNSLGCGVNLIPLIVVLVGIGVMGYAWALAFSKTKSILMPFGFHFGWNFVHNTILSNGPLGDIVFVAMDAVVLPDTLSLVLFMIRILIPPLFTLLYVEYFVASKGIELNSYD